MGEQEGRAGERKREDAKRGDEGRGRGRGRGSEKEKI